MANVLILSLVFPPDSVSTAHIMGDLAQDLKISGHTVTVLTTCPHYNRDSEAESRQPLRRHWGRILQKSDYHGIEVFHTMMPKKSKNVLFRLSSWVVFHLLSTIVGLVAIPKQDIVIAPSPPLTVGLGAWLLGMFHRAPYIYNVQEIYPDMAIRLGAVRNPILVRFLFWLERFVYSKAGSITVIAPGMRKRLLAKGVPADKARVIPNFVDLTDFKPQTQTGSFNTRYQLHDKFVVTYAGNMGVAQGLETFVDAAGVLRSDLRIHFLMLGDGSLREFLERRVTELRLDNFTFLPYQPVSTIPAVYSASDLCLVPLGAEAGNDAVPSKVYRIMACARAVLAVAEADSDLGQLVTDARCGIVVPPGSVQNLADAILAASQNPELLWQMGQHGHKHVVENFSRSLVTKEYHELIERLTEYERCAA